MGYNKTVVVRVFGLWQQFIFRANRSSVALKPSQQLYMILMPQIFDVTANENARYKSNELKLSFSWKHRLTLTKTDSKSSLIKV